jgi:hypothetical protein
MSKQQVAKIRVKFFCPFSLKTVHRDVGLATSALRMRGWSEGKSPCLWRVSPRRDGGYAKLLHHWILDFSCWDTTVSGRDVRDAMSKLNCEVKSVRLLPHKMPILKRPRKPKAKVTEGIVRHPLDDKTVADSKQGRLEAVTLTIRIQRVCNCKQFPFCEHVQLLTSDQALAQFEAEGNRDRVRRQQRDQRSVDSFLK